MYKWVFAYFTIVRARDVISSNSECWVISHYDHLPLGGGYLVAASSAPKTQKWMLHRAPRTNDAQPLITKVALKMILEL